MSDAPLDSKRDRMMQALYGELSADGMKAFKELVAGDEDLRREWEELCQARQLLSSSLSNEGTGDGAPDFLPLPGILPGGQRLAVRAQAGPWRWVVAGFLGAALAAGLFAVLLFSGLRMDRTPQGLLIGFRPATAQQPDAANPAGNEHRQESIPAQRTGRQRVYDRAAYLTKDDFELFALTLAQMTARTLEEQDKRRGREQAALVMELYDVLAERDRQRYDDMRAWIEFAGYRTGYPQGAPGFEATNLPVRRRTQTEEDVDHARNP